MAINVDSQRPIQKSQNELVKKHEYSLMHPRKFLYVMLVFTLLVSAYNSPTYDQALSYIQAQSAELTLKLPSENTEFSEIPEGSEFIESRDGQFEKALFPYTRGENIEWFTLSVGKTVAVELSDHTRAEVRITAIRGQELLWDGKDGNQYVYKQPLTFEGEVLDHPSLHDPTVIQDPNQTAADRKAHFDVEMIVLE